MRIYLLSKVWQEVNGQAVWISEEECKGPEVGACVACIKYCKEAPMSREERGESNKAWSQRGNPGTRSCRALALTQSETRSHWRVFLSRGTAENEI